MKDLNHLFGRIPIRLKLLILMIGLATIPLISFFLFSSLVGLNELRKLSLNTLRSDALTIGSRVDDFLETMGGDLIRFTKSPQLHEYFSMKGHTREEEYRKRVELQLLMLAQHNPFYHQLRFLDRQGMEVIRIEHKRGSAYALPPTVLQMKAHRYYFQQAIELEAGQMFVSQMDYNIEHGMVETPLLPVFRYATPVEFKGQREGIFIINVYARSLLEVLQGTPSMNYERLHLVDKQGKILASGSQKNGIFDLFLNDEKNTDPRIIKLIGSEISGNHHIRTSLSEFMVDYPVIPTSLHEGEHWHLVLEGEQDKIISPFIIFGGYSIAILLICIMVALGFGLLAARHFYRPLLQLREGARRIAVGDYDIRIPVRTNDELEDLAQDFTMMATSLESRDLQIREHQSSLENLIELRTQEIILEKEKLERVVEGIGAGMLLIDRSHKVVWCNDYFQQKLNHFNSTSERNCCELLSEELSYCGNCLSEKQCGDLEKVFQHHVLEQPSKEINCLDGHERIFLGRISPIHNHSGEIVYALYILYDITEKELMERREQNLKSELIRAERLSTLGRFTAGIAHEVGNPLGAIRITAQSIQEDFSENSSQWQQLELIVSEIQRLSKITRDLNTFGKPSPPEILPHLPEDILSGLKMLIEGEAKAKGVHVNISTDSNPGLIHVDAQQIQQVLLNLVVNSLQSMPEGGTLNLEIKRNKQLSDESQIVFSVADTGVGIPSEHLDLIFEPFFTTRKQGSGLGLALAHTLVTQNHGNISVESKPNQGTTFFIRFPLYLENQEQSLTLSA